MWLLGASVAGSEKISFSLQRPPFPYVYTSITGTLFPVRSRNNAWKQSNRCNAGERRAYVCNRLLMFGGE